MITILITIESKGEEFFINAIAGRIGEPTSKEREISNLYRLAHEKIVEDYAKANPSKPGHMIEIGSRINPDVKEYKDAK